MSHKWSTVSSMATLPLPCFCPRRPNHPTLDNGRSKSCHTTVCLQKDLTNYMRSQQCIFFSPHLFGRRLLDGTICLIGQSRAFDTMRTIYVPAAPRCALEKAKSKPVEDGGDWGFRENLADGSIPSKELWCAFGHLRISDYVTSLRKCTDHRRQA